MLDERTLVLNRHWAPISTTSVRRALVLVVRGAAGVVHPETLHVASWDQWTGRAVRGSARGEGAGDGVVGNGAPATTSGASHRTVRGFDLEVRVPEVIVLTRYDGYPTRGVAFTRRNVYRRDGYTCQYCRARPGMSDLTIDHVIPRSRGGASSWENCVTACRPCNARKANRTTHEIDLRLPRPPAAPRWPGGLDPASVRARPLWQRFLPASAVAVGA
jgi:5-methylcytosine-specific restriction endonuclease McrA